MPYELADQADQDAASTAPAGQPTGSMQPTPAPQPQMQTGGEQPVPSMQAPMSNLPEMQKAGWSTKVYHGILDSLAGKFDTQYIPTENGVVKQDVAQGPGQQWKKIIAGALSGFAGAQAAGTQGPGGAMRGAGAGVAAGMKMAQNQDQQKQTQANTEFDQQQKAAMSKAQRSMMNIELAQKTFALGQGEKEAAVGDSQRANQFMEAVHNAEKVGGRMLGHYDTPDKALEAFQSDPTMHGDLSHGRIINMPHVENGKIHGVDAAYVPDDFMTAMTNYDIPVTYKFWENGKAKEVTHVIPAGATTNGAAMDIQTKLSTMQMEDHWKEYEAQYKLKELKMQGEHLQLAMNADQRAAKADQRAAQAFPKEQEERDARIEALKNKDPYSQPPQAQGTFDPNYPPIQNFARGTPGIDVRAVQKGLSADDQKTERLSNNVISNAKEAVAIIDGKQFPQLSGSADGRVTRLKQWLGTDDPAISGLNAYLENMALASIGIHGMRNFHSVEEVKDNILKGWVNGPDAAKAAIAASVHSANDFIGQTENKRNYGTPTGPDRSRQIIFGGTGQPMANQQTPGTVSWTPPTDAPEAPKEDNKYLYDANRRPVAKSLGGKWVQP